MTSATPQSPPVFDDSRYDPDVPVTVRPIVNAADMKIFIDVPWHIYDDDPCWVPPLRLERRLHFSRFNPWCKHGQWQGWVAWRGGSLAGRISAQVDHLHRAHHGADTGHFGLLECVDDAAVMAALMARAEAWLSERCAVQISGPFNFSINQECGVLVDGFDTPPVLMMPHSRRWYGRLLEQCGYVARKDLLAYWVNVEFERPAIMRNVIKNHPGSVRVRALKSKKIGGEIEVLQDIFNDAWSENWGFIPFTREEFAELVSMLKWVLPDGFVQIAEVDGTPAAFIVGLPNLNEIFADLDGSLFPLGWLRLIRRLKARQVRTGRVPLMGVRKRYQQSALGMALAFMVIDGVRESFQAAGIREVEMSWILEDNEAMRSILDSIGSHPYKRYRIYGKTLTGKTAPEGTAPTSLTSAV